MYNLFGKNIITDLKNYYLNNDNSIKSKKLLYNCVCKLFPGFKEIFDKNFIKEEFREVMFCLLNDISEIPKCKNKNCFNKVPLRNYNVGFLQCCCKSCVAQCQSQSIEFKNKISKTKKLNNNINIEFLNEKNIQYEKNENYIILKNYSKFGDEAIYYKTLCKIHEIGQATFSYKLNEELYINCVPSKTEIEDFLNKFDQFFKQFKHNISYKFFILYFPKQLKIIDTYYLQHCNCQNINDIRLSERIYFFYHHLTNKPQCLYKNCDNYCDFFNKGYGYPLYCKEHINIVHATSKGENEIKQYLIDIGVLYIENNRSIISEELDIYCPDFNIAIEFNGVYFHSNKFKHNNYHFKKFKKCLDHNIYLIQIWEDEWNNNKNELKEFLKSVFNNKEKGYIINEEHILKCNCNKDNILFYLNNGYIIDEHIEHYTYLFNGNRTNIDYAKNDIKCYDAGYIILKLKEEPI